jgi:hypothetical protein
MRDEEMCASESITPMSREYGSKRRDSPRSGSSTDQELHQPPIGTNDNTLEADLITDYCNDINFDFDSWNAQIIRSDMPPNIRWPLLDRESLPPLPILNASSDIFLARSPPSSTVTMATLFQDHEVATTSFPDTSLLPIPALTLLHASLTIAARLGIAMQIWDCASISPFYTRYCPSLDDASENSVSSTTCGSGIDIDIASLPENLRPTRTQRLLSHHPLLDILPWPSVRDKLIMYFSQPVGLRPAELGMGQLVADLEDEAEGVVVRAGGTEPWEVKNWEVGRALEKRWWFVLDAKVKRRR